MGNYQVGIGEVSAFDLKDSESSFTRTGLNGAEPIFNIFGRHYFFGEVLGGGWQKGYDGVMIGPNTIMLNGGDLEFYGGAAVAGNFDAQWLVNRKAKVWLVKDGVELIVGLEVPVAVTATRAIHLQFFLVGQDVGDDVSSPELENDWLKVEMKRDETAGNFQYRIRKSVKNVVSDVIGWAVVTNEDIEVKLVFQEKVAGHTHIYLDDGVLGTFTEHGSSPFALGLSFDRAYPAFRQYTDDATDRTCESNRLVVTYPNWVSNYDLADVDENKGDCEIWDERNEASESDWVQMFSEDHVFVGDCVIQNGLTRVWIDEAASLGFKLYYYLSGWVQLLTTIYPTLQTSSKNLTYPFLQKIVSMSPEKIVIQVRFRDSATVDEDYYIDANVTLRRGIYLAEIEHVKVFPDEAFAWVYHSMGEWGYVGDAESHGIGDDELNLHANNTTMSDNFLVGFDDSGDAVIGILAVTKKPSLGSVRYQAYQGGKFYLQHFDFDNDPKVFMGGVPFALIANLFTEAEDGALTAGATEVDPDVLAHGSKSVLLNAQSERILINFTAGTDLPAGRYLAIWRAKDTGQVADDFGLYVYNITDGKHRGEENAIFSVGTLTASYAFYQQVFDVTDEDVNGTDAITIIARKLLADANSIYVDYLLIVPIGNGESWPQDLSHAALRTLGHPKNVDVR